MQQFLAESKRVGPERSHVVRQRASRVEEPIGGHHSVDKPYLERFLGVDPSAGEGHLAGAPMPDCRSYRGKHDDGEQSDADLTHAELRAFGRDHDVACRHDAAPTGQRVAVGCADHRFGHRADRRHQRDPAVAAVVESEGR